MTGGAGFLSERCRTIMWGRLDEQNIYFIR